MSESESASIVAWETGAVWVYLGVRYRDKQRKYDNGARIRARCSEQYESCLCVAWNGPCCWTDDASDCMAEAECGGADDTRVATEQGSERANGVGTCVKVDGPIAGEG